MIAITTAEGTGWKIFSFAFFFAYFLLGLMLVLNIIVSMILGFISDYFSLYEEYELEKDAAREPFVSRIFGMGQKKKYEDKQSKKLK